MKKNLLITCQSIKLVIVINASTTEASSTLILLVLRLRPSTGYKETKSHGIIPTKWFPVVLGGFSYNIKMREAENR